MRRLSIIAALGCSLALGLLGGDAARAQTLGTLQGKVNDESKAPLPGVTVKITNTGTGYVRTVFTDANGFYTAPSLPSGVYSVEASLEGLQTVRQENIRLLVGQILDVNLAMSVQSMTEAITVTAESPVVEVSRSSAAKYVSEEEIVNLPIAGRDFVDFALLTPQVRNETDRGGISVAGQRGVNTGLTLDGTSGKSAFFGYGRGGEATENNGLVVAQDSVKEFQVITNGFAPEFGQSGGGYVNVVTKSGTNDFKGTAFFLFRNEDLVSDLPLSPFDEEKGNECDADGGIVPCTPAQFERINWGASIGGPIIKDKTHFFFSYDQLTRESPENNVIDIPGLFNAVNSRYPEFLEGYTFDAETGEARAQFNETVDNLILFGKIDHQLSEKNTLSVRYNYTDYEFKSEDLTEESSKPEKTHSLVGQLVTLLGDNAVNEFRIHYAEDNFERRAIFEKAATPDRAFELLFNISGFSRIFLGKADFLPIFVNESKFQIQDNFSYLFGDHDLKFGFDFQRDNMKQYFAGFADGQYEYRSVDAFLNNTPSQVRVFFGDVNNPNFNENQSALGIYAQDSWKASSKLTLNFGLRWEGTFNPQNIPHVFAEDGSGLDIPHDLDNFAPRVGFAYTLDEEGKSVLRGGAGLFYSRTPVLLWAGIVTSNGLPPNLGATFLNLNNPFPQPGEPIDNSNAPAGTRILVNTVDSDFEDPETWRFNVGYEREVRTNWSAGVDLIYAHGENLHSNNDLNRTVASRDEFGRVIYSSTRPDPNFTQIFVRDSPGWSNYFAATLSLNKRWSNGYQIQGHYTFSVDKDTDSNERTATTITITDIEDVGYDYGLSARDVTHRFVLSGVAELPLEFKLGGAFFLQSGIPYTALDSNFATHRDPNGTSGVQLPRAVVNGELQDRNGERNESVSKLDLRLSKFFDVGRARIEAFGEVFNVFNSVSFLVGTTQAQPLLRDGTPNADFGLARNQYEISTQRQIQLGARVSF
jgi:hypothetical protein